MDKKNLIDSLESFSIVHFKINGKEYGAKILMDDIKDKKKILDCMDNLYGIALRKAERVLNGI